MTATLVPLPLSRRRSLRRHPHLWPVVAMALSVPKPVRSFRGFLPFVAHPVTGKQLRDDGETTLPPGAGGSGGGILGAAGCKDYSMVVFPVQESRRVLLEMPNALGWRYHFGCEGTDPAHDVRASVFDGRDAEFELRPAGLMLFTFATTDDAPMRVRVYRCDAEALSGERPGLSVGKGYGFDEVPYDLMWACLLYTSPSPRDQRGSRMPSSA